MGGRIFVNEAVNGLTNMALSNTGQSLRSSVFCCPTLIFKLMPKMSHPSDKIQHYAYKETAQRIARGLWGHKAVNQLMIIALL